MFNKKLKNLIDASLLETQKKQEKFTKKYNIKKTTRYDIKDNGIIKAYNNKKLLFKAKYQIIGTFNYKSNFFRPAWSNKFIPKKLSIVSRKLKKLNKEYETYIFNQELLEGHGWGRIMTSIALKLENKTSYLVKNDHDSYPETYIILDSIDS